MTICTYNRLKLFGDITGGKMTLSRLGEVADEEWRHIAQARINGELDRYVIMPNHLHGLFTITDMPEGDFGQSGKNTRAKQPHGYPAGSVGAIISHYKAAVSRRARSESIGRSHHIWQRSYYDHVVRNEKSLNETRRYIIENPARWQDDRLYSE